MGKMMMTILLTCGLGQGWAQTSPGPASKTKAAQNKPRATQKSPVKPSTQLVEQRALLTTLTDDLLAVAAQVPGLLAERWLFFAQARHPQNLYYQTVS